MYLDKYLKYKNKYLTLKTKYGGSKSQSNNTLDFSINETYIDSNNIYKKEDFEGDVHIDFDYDDNKLYTTIMVDENAVNTDKDKYYVHLLKINNTGPFQSDLDDNEILSYVPPTPPINTGIISKDGTYYHQYHIYIYEQSSKIKKSNYSRYNFDLDDFIKINKLKEVGHFTYKVTSNK